VLDGLLGSGLQPGEEALPEDAAGTLRSPSLALQLPYLSAPAPATPTAPQFDEAAMAQLEAMGFPTIRCQKALLATGGADAEAAMEWLFAHMEDPGTSLPRARRILRPAVWKP
jgi:ubiquitin carboxyl-terminal hydrolase 5/13